MSARSVNVKELAFEAFKRGLSVANDIAEFYVDPSPEGIRKAFDEWWRQHFDLTPSKPTRKSEVEWSTGEPEGSLSMSNSRKRTSKSSKREDSKSSKPPTVKLTGSGSNVRLIIE